MPPDLFPGYVFRDPRLLERALTRRSYANDHFGSASEEHNEALEFLGDAVIGLLVRQRVLARLSHAREGRLHDLYARFVNRRALASMARHFGLHEHLRAGRGDQILGVDAQDKAMEDAMEAVAGALFLDGGLRAAEVVLGGHLDEALDRFFAAGAPGEAELRDPKSRLQEWCQAKKLAFTYTTTPTEGGFRAVLHVRALQLGEGFGRTKALAEKEAAAAALVALGVDRALAAAELPAHLGPAAALRAAVPPRPRALPPDAKSALFQRAQLREAGRPTTEFTRAGPADRPTFTAWVTVEGQRFGPGRGPQARAAEQAACALALAALDPDLEYVGRPDRK